MLTRTEAATRGDSYYVIPALSPEKERLEKQYAMKKSVYGWRSGVPGCIDLSKIHNIMDVAAGTCAWTLDLAAALDGRDDISLYACDINTGLFPDKDILERSHISIFQHDVTKPFPPQYRGLFDLVHTSFLFICLTEDGWTRALENLHDLLKPNGILMIDEADPIFFTEKRQPPSETAAGHDVASYMSGQTWIDKANCIYIGHALQNGFVVGLTFRLASMLKRVGFVIHESQRITCPVGKQCLVQRGLDGESLARYSDDSLSNLEFVLQYLAASMLQQDALEVPKGAKVKTQNDTDSILAEVKAGLKQEGAALLGCYCVARLGDA